MVLIRTIVPPMEKSTLEASNDTAAWQKKLLVVGSTGFNFSEFNSLAIDKVIGQDNEVIAAFDQSFDGKADKKT